MMDIPTFIKTTCVAVPALAGAILVWHQLDHRQDRNALADMHIEAVISRLNRLCRLQARNSEFYTTDHDIERQLLLVKYERLQGSPWSGKCNDLER